VFLFELCAIAARDDSAHSELDPIFVFFGLLFRSRGNGLFIARPSANSSSGKSSRKNHYQEFARGFRHNIQVNT
jgi:hypothetical protein